MDGYINQYGITAKNLNGITINFKVIYTVDPYAKVTRCVDISSTGGGARFSIAEVITKTNFHISCYQGVHEYTEWYVEGY